MWSVNATLDSWKWQIPNLLFRGNKITRCSHTTYKAWIRSVGNISKQRRQESEFLHEWQDNASSISQAFLVAKRVETRPSKAVFIWVADTGGIICPILPLLQRLWPPFLFSLSVFINETASRLVVHYF